MVGIGPAGGNAVKVSGIRSSRVSDRSPPERPAVASAWSFGETLSAARAGGEWAWTAIYSRFAPAALGYLRAQGAPDPDDLLGEVFLQVVRDLERFRGDERDFRAWLFTIAHHRLLDDRRRHGRRPADATPAEAIVAAGPVGDSEEEALERLETERVRGIIGRLAPDQRNVLLLRVLGDMTVEEVARTLGKRAGAVKALQRRGLAAIKKEIERGA
jgi:RNA polymerase sigma-70 factor (ECF subfamily)